MVNYESLVIKGKELKLRLDTRRTIEIEKKHGLHPMALLGAAMQEGELPSLELLLDLLHASAQKFQHGMTIDKIYDIYDMYIDEGHNMGDLITLMFRIFVKSGYMSQEDYDAAMAKAEIGEQDAEEEIVVEVEEEKPEENQEW